MDMVPCKWVPNDHSFSTSYCSLKSVSSCFFVEEGQHFITHDIFIQEYVGLLVFIVTMVTLSSFSATGTIRHVEEVYLKYI